jgi:hypothetical protein
MTDIECPNGDSPLHQLEVATEAGGMVYETGECVTCGRRVFPKGAPVA